MLKEGYRSSYHGTSGPRQCPGDSKYGKDLLLPADDIRFNMCVKYKGDPATGQITDIESIDHVKWRNAKPERELDGRVIGSMWGSGVMWSMSIILFVISVGTFIGEYWIAGMILLFICLLFLMGGLLIWYYVYVPSNDLDKQTYNSKAQKWQSSEPPLYTSLKS